MDRELLRRVAEAVRDAYLWHAPPDILSDMRGVSLDAIIDRVLAAHTAATESEYERGVREGRDSLAADVLARLEAYRRLLPSRMATRRTNIYVVGKIDGWDQAAKAIRDAIRARAKDAAAQEGE